MKSLFANQLSVAGDGAEDVQAGSSLRFHMLSFGMIAVFMTNWQI